MQYAIAGSLIVLEGGLPTRCSNVGSGLQQLFFVHNECHCLALPNDGLDSCEATSACSPGQMLSLMMLMWDQLSALMILALATRIDATLGMQTHMPLGIGQMCRQMPSDPALLTAAQLFPIRIKRERQD